MTDTELRELMNTDVYSEEMLAELSKRENVIKTALSSIDKNMEKAAFSLYWIYFNRAYKAMGFESITDYALKTFDIGKSTTYSFINLVGRFAARDEKGLILDKFDKRYKDYSLSKLSLLADLDDFEIEGLNISPDMSVRDIKKCLKAEEKKKYTNALLSKYKEQECSDKKDTTENPEIPEPDSQGTMTITGNELSVPSTPELNESDDCDDEGIFGYKADTVYEFSVQDDERAIVKEIKAILKKNRTEHEESSFSLILRYPVRKGEN